MKIKSLKIHNIASIEDAEIDFCSEPLKSANLFLLTGTTGSGKTTILDSICLALYNTTPRLEKGETEKINANKDNLTGKDPRNLMRSNTGEAYVNLWFTGNNGKEYLACWYLSRGERKRPDASLSNVVWTIANLTDKTETSADKRSGYIQVRDIIHAAIGLDFGQFCRTSMLPQGEFTEFLKSDENAKAEILEKISGCDLYSKIGQEIYALSSKAEQDYKKELAKKDEIAVLTDLQREAIKSEIVQKKAEADIKTNSIKDIEEKIGWLNEFKNASGNYKSSIEELNLEREKEQATEFRQMEKTVKEWTLTADIRSVLKSKNELNSELDEVLERLYKSKENWFQYLGYKAYLVDLIGKYKAKFDELSKLQLAEECNQNAYSHIVDIAGLLTVLSENTSKILKSKDKLAEKCEAFPEATNKMNSSKKEFEAIESECKTVSQAYQQAKEHFDACNIGLLRQEKEEITTLKTAKEQVQSLIKELFDNRNEEQAKSVELTSLEEHCRQEKDKLTILEREDNLRKETVGQMVTALRAKLNEVLGSEDSICPVCRQRVVSLPSDALISEEYARFSSVLKEQKKLYETSLSNYNLAKAELASILKNQKLLEKKLDLAQKAVDAIVIELQAKETLSGEVAGLANISDLEALINDCDDKIKNAEIIERQMNEIKETLSQLTDEKFSKSKASQSALADFEQIKTAIQAYQEEIAEYEAKVKLHTTELDKHLEGSEFAGVLSRQDVSFLDLKMKLESRRKGYDTLEEDLDNYRTKINNYSQILEQIEESEEEIKSLQPAWTVDKEVVAIKPEKNPSILWTELKAEVETNTKQIEWKSAKRAECQNALDAYFVASPQMDEKRLAELNLIDTAQFTSIKEIVESVKSNIANLSASVKASSDILEDLSQRKPKDLKDSDSIVGLEDVKKNLEDQKNSIFLNVGSLENQLALDNENRALKGDTSKLDELKAVAQRWSELNREFGDKEGRKLRKIAQSYILEGLLDSANVHLKTMAPRYRLLVNPGTLNLKLEDRYNGYSTRSTNSISGGESFLVSLSLALALADFGQHLGVSTLFIDEGFGTLSGAHLQSAINTLQALHSNSGRQVGIISHREEIRESIPVRIEVSQKPGSWASTVRIY